MKLRNKKALGLFLSFAVTLCVAAPNTLAAEADTDAVDDPILVENAAEQNHPETPIAVEAPIEAEKVCTCVIHEDGTLTCTEGCPVHEVPAPVEAEAPKHMEGCSDACNGADCTCPCHAEKTQVSAELQVPAHTEGCSDDCTAQECACSCHAKAPETPAAPATPAPIEDSADQCSGVDCENECHKPSLFNRLMKCETHAELMEMIEAAPEEERMTLTSEQTAQVEEKVMELKPQPLPEIIVEQTADEPVVSEIIYPTVNFDKVAPFGAPVIG